MDLKNINFLILFVFLAISSLTFGQKYLLPNEVIIYSFETQNGKKVMLAKDKNEKYIVYRYGTKNKIEFEFPEKTKESWLKFSFSFYSRGGGIQNEGMELNQISFTNNDYKYFIFDSYYSVENEKSIGVKILNLKNKKITVIKGKNNSKKGKLNTFRENKLLRIEEPDVDE